MVNGDKCDLCGVSYTYSDSEVWRFGSDELSVRKNAVAFAIIGWKTRNEMQVCEVCYEKGRLQQTLNDEQLSEAFYQFGLEFINKGQLEKAKTAFSRCISIKESADGLASLGYVENSLGNETSAAELYRRALELQPDHFMARENLRKLSGSKKGDNSGNEFS